MKIGIPRETRAHEYRVAMLPVGVEELAAAGHEVIVEQGAGDGSGYPDAAYARAGARIVEAPEPVFGEAELLVKVKEPGPREIERLHAGQVLFTYFHFAASRELTRACLEAGITAFAYETLTDGRSRLPLLTPMSEVAGRMSIQEGAKFLEKPMMGRGILLGGVTGVEPGNVLILGAGVVGTNAARMAAGLGANVTIMDVDLERLRHVDRVMPPNVHTAWSHAHAIADHLPHTDLLIGAVLIPGGRTPVLVRQRHLETMKQGAVIVDVGVDQGGCVESIRPTTHEAPSYVASGVVHYGVTNMPGAVGRTSTQALAHATQPWILRLADRLAEAPAETIAESEPAFGAALNLHAGRIRHEAVARAYRER